MSTRPVHTLYRFFDASGALLYVGRTVDARSRFRSHERSKEWFEQVARIDREIFPDAESLAHAEILAIKSENPLHNIQHAGPRPSLRVIREDPDDRIPRRQATIAAIWNTDIPQARCSVPDPEMGCECAACVGWIFERLDIDREDHADDRVLVERLNELEREYLNGAGVMDWLYDLGDAIIFRRFRLVEHSASAPAPALAYMEDGRIQVGCPFCLGLHEHYVASGAAVQPLAAACAGRGQYLPVFDTEEAIESSAGWIRSIA